MEERKLELDIRYLPSPETLKFVSIGFKPALADAVWIEALNYFGGELLNKKRTYQYLVQYLDPVFVLDPLFAMLYEWAGTVFIYNALPITKESVSKSTYYANLGIQNLAKEGRYSFNIISKGAFNFALEAHDYEHAIPYFEMAGRAFPDRRDMLLVGSSYAANAGLEDVATNLKMEYLGFAAFEAQTKQELIYAMQVITSNRFNKQATNLIRSFRVQMEKDEDIKKLIELRLEANPIFQTSQNLNSSLSTNIQLQKVLAVDFQRNWLPPDLHLLLSI